MKKLITVAALTLVAVTGCSTATHTSSGTSANATPVVEHKSTLDTDLATARQLSPELVGVPDATLVHTAQAVCNALDGGLTMDAIFTASEGNGVRPYTIGVIIGLATSDLCPEYASVAQNWADDNS